MLEEGHNGMGGPLGRQNLGQERMRDSNERLEMHEMLVLKLFLITLKCSSMRTFDF